jgi:type II secretory pathway pseudopilin PulG
MVEREPRKRLRHCGARGFTVVEVLVIVGLIGIVAALALHNATGYRQRAQDALAAHDVGTAIAAEEAYFAENRRYAPVGSIVGPAEVKVPGFLVSARVKLEVEADAESFRVTATSLVGSGVVYEYDSDTGVITQN